MSIVILYNQPLQNIETYCWEFNLCKSKLHQLKQSFKSCTRTPTVHILSNRELHSSI